MKPVADKIAALRSTLSADLVAGLTTAMVTIPDGMASGVLVGVSPMNGLYALMMGTPVGALFTSSQFMYVANTGAMAVAAGSALSGFSGDEKVQALIALTILVGVFQLLLGLAKLGSITRFVSNAVLAGFMNGVALLIILGQIGDFTGFHSTYDNKVVRLVDLLFNLNEMHIQTLLIGLATIGCIVLISQTRLGKFSMIGALLASSLLVRLLGWNEIALVGEVADLSGLRLVPSLPELRLIPQVISGAIAVGLIGLVQAAGVSKTVPNADGTYSDISRDFVGQGAANVVSGVFKGLPIGGAMSETAVNVQAGAKTRWAAVYSGLVIIVSLVLFTGVVSEFAMPAIAALLIVAGYQSLKFDDIADVWDVGLGPRIVMVLTFGLTLTVPVQVAVFWGVVVSGIIYWYRSASDVRVVEIVLERDGSYREQPAPSILSSNSVTVIHIYGSVFYGAASVLEGLLPSAQGAQRAVVVLRLRGRNDIGTTLIRVLERYAIQLQKGGGKLMLTGVSQEAKAELDRTETTETIPEEDMYLADDRLGASSRAAYEAAHAWISAQPIDE